MRLYNIVSEILLILPIIDFAVTAPVLVQEKLQARVNVVHTPAHAMTMLWKRADDSELDELGVKLFSHPESHSVSKPEELPAAHPPGGSSATRPLSSSRPPGLADGSMAVKKPLPSISKEPQQMSSSDRVPLSVGDELNKMWVNLIGQPEAHFSPVPDALSATRPPSISQMSGPSDRSMAVEKPLPSIPKGPSQVSRPDRARLSADDMHGLMRMWLDIIGQPSSAKPEVSSAARPLSSSPSGPSTESDHEMVGESL